MQYDFATQDRGLPGVSVDTSTGVEINGPTEFKRSEAAPAAVVSNLFVGIAVAMDVRGRSPGHPSHLSR